MKETSSLSKATMILLSLYPILHAYSTSFNLRYNEIAFIIVIIWAFAKKGLKTFQFPKSYFIFWAYAAISLIAINIGDFHITYLIPGGIAFFLFSLCMGISVRYFNIDYFYKAFRVCFLICAVVFIVQAFDILPEQYNTCLVLPISHHVSYAGLDFNDLVAMRSTTTRDSSLFLEPAYYAIYCCIFLILELFYKGKGRVFTPFSYVVILLIVAIRSGTGLLGLALILTAKLLTIWKTEKKNRWKILLAVVCIAGAGAYYIGTEDGAKMVDRSKEFSQEGSSGYIRVIRGALMFDNLPATNKLLGISQEGLVSYNTSLLDYNALGEYDTTMNGIFTLLNKNGLLGLILLLIIYVEVCRKSLPIGKTSILFLLLISFIEQTYLMYPMLLCTVIVCNDFALQAGANPEQKIIRKETE